MKPALKHATAAALVVLAACGANIGEDPAEAARADSSAAGYSVGEHTGGMPAAADSAKAVAGSPNVGQAARAGAAVAVVTTNHPAATVAVAPAREKPGTKPVDSLRVASATRTPLPNVGAKPARVDSVLPQPVPAGPVRVNEFLAYDARSQTVSLQLIAGYNGLNGSLNYNGATNGSHGIMVPLGWRIHVGVANRDSDLQHSAIVVREVLPPPIEPVDPAFSGAALPQLDEGLQEGETGTLDFVADRAGRFMIACGVAGHAQAGMWLQLTVLKDATVPAYR